jgi:hypothetical protein
MGRPRNLHQTYKVVLEIVLGKQAKLFTFI